MGCLFVFHYHVLYYGINISRLQKLCLDNLCSLSLSTLYMPIYEVYMPHALYMPIYEVCSVRGRVRVRVRVRVRG